MHRLLFSATTFLAISSLSALACPHNAHQFICPGDQVVDPSGDRGEVRAINPAEETAAVKYQNSGEDQNWEVADLALRQGCLDGICVGDLAVDSSGSRGIIDAVNPYSSTIAIRYRGNSEDQIWDASNVAMGFGCIRGYCVGDKVVDASGDEGVIEALNRNSNVAAVKYRGNSEDQIWDVFTLSSSVFCATYGESQRHSRFFPTFAANQYISPALHFSLKRPL
jgi:hypothetical protein